MSGHVRERYRTVKLRMWGDEKFRRLSAPAPNAQSLWLYLITGPHTHRVPGLLPVGMSTLAEGLGWSRDDFQRVFDEIAAQGMAIADWSAPLVWLPNAVVHNPPQSPNVVRAWAADLVEIPECALKQRAGRRIYAFLDGFSEAYPKAFREAYPKGFQKTRLSLFQ